MRAEHLDQRDELINARPDKVPVFSRAQQEPRMGNAKSNQDQLLEWLRANRPGLFEQVQNLGASSISAMMLLNHETGLNVRPLDTIEEGGLQFLEAFKATIALHGANERQQITPTAG